MFWLRYKINNFQLQALTWGAQKNRLIERVLLCTHNIIMLGSRNKIDNFQLGGLQPILYDDSVMHFSNELFPLHCRSFG